MTGHREPGLAPAQAAVLGKLGLRLLGPLQLRSRAAEMVRLLPVTAIPQRVPCTFRLS